MQAELYAKPCKMCQQFKNRKTLYGNISPKNTAELKPWDSVHVDLIGLYSKSIRQQQPGGAIINNNVSLAWTVIIDPVTVCFEIFKIPTYGLNDVTCGNNEYIDKSHARVIHISAFKQYFTPLLKYLDIKHVLTTTKNPQSNAPVERVHQVILNMLVTKYLDNKVFNYIDPWGENLAYISWVIRVSYPRTIMATPVQYVFGRYMIFYLALVVD